MNLRLWRKYLTIWKLYSNLGELENSKNNLLTGIRLNAQPIEDLNKALTDLKNKNKLLKSGLNFFDEDKENSFWNWNDVSPALRSSCISNEPFSDKSSSDTSFNESPQNYQGNSSFEATQPISKYNLPNDLVSSIAIKKDSTTNIISSQPDFEASTKISEVENLHKDVAKSNKENVKKHSNEEINSSSLNHDLHSKTKLFTITNSPPMKQMLIKENINPLYEINLIKGSDDSLNIKKYSEDQNPFNYKIDSIEAKENIVSNEELSKRNLSVNNITSDEATIRAAPVLHKLQEQIISLEPFVISSLVDEKSVTINGMQYKKIDIIGKGGSSKVYKIMNEEGKLFALKKVKLKGQEESIIDGYLNEIALLKKMKNNDRIIRLIDYETIKGQVMYMVLEYGEIDLAQLLIKQNSTLSPNFIRMYFEQILRAVHAIHEENIIHSDLKPANFMLVEAELKLIDFGIAKTISNDTTNIHRETQTGTVNYMSPEALNFVETSSQQKYLKLGRSSDVWSIGCILYQFVYGKPPFAHFKNVVQKLQAISNPKHKINFPVINDALLLEVIQSCLQFNPKARPTIPQLLQHPYITGIHHVEFDLKNLNLQNDLKSEELIFNIIKKVFDKERQKSLVLKLIKEQN
ncbi:hypothetical protein HK099_006839 [Clydaea vesicula]|uniref:Protein kinase domain-containing protein n=1 Tax=Clydaea vesicula TaxID=447962 RepID=A0AAD5XU21_9FUNG|nr:hypothetical protein HK099_006839 [Clydaea vesicula]